MGLLKGLLIGLMLSGASVDAWCQELNCKIDINADRVDVSSRGAIDALRTAVSDYMNTTAFTEKKYEANEKIDCRLFFALKSVNNDNFTAELQVQSSRPVYDSTYTTQLINFRESDLSFVYRQGEPMTFSRNARGSQLTSVLDFYAYLILALDSDSFTKRGGDEYYKQLERVVQMGQSAGEKGWRQYESPTSRGAILAALTNPSTVALRDMIYTYHRVGLDLMASDAKKGRAAISACQKRVLPEVYDANPMSVGLTMWRDAKLDEMIGIFGDTGIADKKEIAKLLRDIFPSDTERINRIEEKK